MTASTKHRSTRRVRRWLLAFALPLCANAADDYNLNAAFVTNEMKTGALSFPGPNGGTVCVGYNFTPSTPAALTTAGLIHIDSWALSPYIQGWYYPNSAIVPAIVVNTNSAAVDTGFAITGARQIHMHPGYPSANAAIEPSGWAVLRYTVASNGTYSIKGEFQSLNSGTVNVDVLKNGVSILSSGANEDATPFYEIVALAVGDVIDFVVGSAGYIAGDSTGLYANVAPYVAPPPTPIDVNLAQHPSEPAGPGTRRGALTISEIMYHPATRADGRDIEFLELYNSQPWPEDLTGWRITGDVSYAFPSGTSIAALGRLVVAAVPADVQAVYGITGVLGPYEGRLSNGGGTLRLRNEGDGICFEVEFASDNAWPPAPDGYGPSLVLARPSLGMNNPRAWEMSAWCGGSPGTAEPTSSNAWRTVLFNEVLANSTGADFIELYNYGTNAVELSGCILTDNPDEAKFAFPSGTSIAAGGFVALTETQLGFAPHAAGDTLTFKSPDGSRVLDAVRFGAQENGVSSGRSPDGAGAWRPLATATAGAANTGLRRADVVLSEIMYHPISGLSDDEFVELYNRSASPVALSGWRLRGEVDFNIPSGTTLAAGARLVLAKNPAHLISNYAGLSSANTLGPFSGKLSDSGARLSLQKPVAYTPEGGTPTTLHVEVDAVTYDSGGRWGKWGDGGGSSLELTDARADAQQAPAWADSDETGKCGWKTIEQTGVLDLGMNAAPADSIQILLLGAGECLVDDVEVIPSGGANCVANGTFAAASGWTFQGTHEASTLSGGVLHLRASDRGNTSNRIFSPLTSTLAAGSTVTIRAKVKWLCGCPEILLRLRGGWLEATGNILTTAALGTPGAANSRAVSNAPPAIAEVTHRPVLPELGQTVTVFARATDPDGVANVFLKYRRDPSTSLTSVAMSPVGAGWFAAQIPAQLSSSLIAFHVAASDEIGASATFPNDAPARECLVRWGDPKPAGDLGTYRIWMTKATSDTWTARLKNSNTPLDVTFAYGETRVIYNASAQYSGSWAHTPSYTGPTGSRCDYALDFPRDDAFLGEKSAVLTLPGSIDADDTSLQREQFVWWMARKIGVPAMHRRYVRVYVNGQLRQPIHEDTQQPGGDFLAEWFPNDDNGRMHKAQDWVEFADGGGYLGDLRATLGNFTTTGGAKKTARYRWLWTPRASADNDFSDFFALVDAHNQADAATYQLQVSALVDVSSWMRAMAVQRIAGNWDSYGWSIGKNTYIYKPPAGRWAMIPWDIDFSLGLTGDSATSDLFSLTSEHIPNEATADPLMRKFRSNVTFGREYWRAFSDAVSGPMLHAAARIDLVYNALVAQGLAPTGTEAVKTYVADRRTYILSQLGTVAAGFSVAGPSLFSTTNSILTLSGTAPVSTAAITINDLEPSITWSAVTAWSASYLLAPGVNTLVIVARDGTGATLGSATLTVTYTGTATWPALRINEWMASNTTYLDPADDDSDDWFELLNPTGTPVDLADWRLTDSATDPAKFVVPSGYSIPAGGHLLVWADNEVSQNTADSPQLHVNFKLSAASGIIALRAPDGTLTDSIAYGAQVTDRAEGRYPEGADTIVALTLPTPGSANALTKFLSLSRDGDAASLLFTTTPGLRYQIEFSEDLVLWLPLGGEQIALDTTLAVEDPLSAVGHRFYRVRVYSD